MKKIVSTVLSAAMVASLSLPVFVGASSTAQAEGRRYCENYARKYANKKTNKKVVQNMIAAGVVGGLLGAAVGGKKATAFGAAGGAGLGMVHSGSKWDKYYWRAYEDCRSW